jgi:hypothetical protein
VAEKDKKSIRGNTQKKGATASASARKQSDFWQIKIPVIFN